MIIKNGRVIDPKSGFDGIADIIIKDGKIKKNFKKSGSLRSPGSAS